MKNSDFESHMVEKHNIEKTYKCDECDKTFLLEWRLRKHRVNHLESLRKCRYFANKQLCPFTQIGCMFSHGDEIMEEPEDIETDDDYTLTENQCHLCKLEFSSRNDLMDHVKSVHIDYFQGMMEVIAQQNQSLI